jgi:hypothetical protein
VVTTHQNETKEIQTFKVDPDLLGKAEKGRCVIFGIFLGYRNKIWVLYSSRVWTTVNHTCFWLKTRGDAPQELEWISFLVDCSQALNHLSGSSPELRKISSSQAQTHVTTDGEGTYVPSKCKHKSSYGNDNITFSLQSFLQIKFKFLSIT